MNNVINVTTEGFNVLSGVNIALKSPLDFPIETAINDIIRRTNGLKFLNVSIGDEKKNFSPSFENMFFTPTTDVSKL